MYIYGKNVVKEALENDLKVKRCFMLRDFSDKAITNLLSNKKVETRIGDKRKLDELTRRGSHQGIVLEVEDYKYKDISVIEDGLVVMLDHIEDPHNFGAIIRTCEAAGVKNIIIPKDRSVSVNGTVTKVSAGTVNSVNIIQVTNLVNTIKELKKKGFWCVGTDMIGDNYNNIDYKGNTIIVIGNEGKGLSRLVLENCDFVASIPMNGTVNSLNASVAAGIVIFEAIRK